MLWSANWLSFILVQLLYFHLQRLSKIWISLSYDYIRQHKWKVGVKNLMTSLEPTISSAVQRPLVHWQRYMLLILNMQHSEFIKELWILVLETLGDVFLIILVAEHMFIFSELKKKTNQKRLKILNRLEYTCRSAGVVKSYCKIHG